MSECVVRMEMPQNCSECAFSTGCSFCEGYNDHCVLSPETADYKWNFADGIEPLERPSWCPIICSLPEGHGRLGDLDELAAGCDSPYWCRWLSEIEDAPTIVPAEAERRET